MPLKISVIGLERWGPNYVRIFSFMKGCQLISIVDQDSGALDKIKNKYPRIKCLQDYQEALSDAKLDPVIIVTPTLTHFAIVRDALNAGKHVLCEKPITNSGKDAWELAALSKKKAPATCAKKSKTLCF